MRRRENVVTATAEHVAPLSRRRLDAQAKEAQGRAVEDGARDAERGADDDGGHDVGQDVADDDLGVGVADDARGGDVVALLDGQDLAADDAGILRDGDQSDGHDGLVDALAERRHEGDGEQDRGHSEHDVHAAHDEGVDGAALVAGDGAERHADGERDGDGQQADGQRDLGAHEDAAEHVAALLVAAEDVRGAGLGERLREVLRVGVVGQDGREQRRDDGDDGEQRDERQAHHGGLVVGQRVPDVLPEGLLLGGLGGVGSDGGGCFCHGYHPSPCVYLMRGSRKA